MSKKKETRAKHVQNMKGATSARFPSIEALESVQDWATIEETRVLTEALVNDQQIAVIESLTAVEKEDQEEEFFG